jgi:hypothetical protein
MAGGRDLFLAEGHWPRRALHSKVDLVLKKLCACAWKSCGTRKVAVCPLPEPVVILRSMEPELTPAAAELLAKDPDRYSTLTHQEAQFLLYGDDGHDCPFENEAEAQAAWAVHRKLLLASYLGSGRRPIAWWVIDFPRLRWRGYDRQRSTLYEARLLEEAERIALIVYWRAEFDQAEGLADDARQKRYREADIPRSLLREWKRGRRRGVYS